jgi:hypothetical protein
MAGFIFAPSVAFCLFSSTRAYQMKAAERLEVAPDD